MIALRITRARLIEHVGPRDGRNGWHGHVVILLARILAHADGQDMPSSLP
jgi:hypothetical protein